MYELLLVHFSRDAASEIKITLRMNISWFYYIGTEDEDYSSKVESVLLDGWVVS